MSDHQRTAINDNPDDAITALTLWQPWASLIAEGVKTIETRSWKAPDDLIGDTIAIHAAARKPRRHVPVGDWLPYRAGDAGPYRMEHYAQGVPGAPQSPVPLPLGAIVATARLVDCIPMLDADATVPEPWMPHLAPNRGKPGWSHWQGPNVHVVVESTGRNPWIIRDITGQVPYGDFAPGRWAWMLDDVAKVEDRCPWCGGDSHDPNGHRGELCPLCAHPGTEPHERGRVAGPIPAKGRQRLWRWSPVDNGHAETPEDPHRNGSHRDGAS